MVYYIRQVGIDFGQEGVIPEDCQIEIDDGNKPKLWLPYQRPMMLKSLATLKRLKMAHVMSINSRKHLACSPHYVQLLQEKKHLRNPK